ncbi:MAG: MFS transporter [Gemmatimonadetes bacterium]|nr:MFS transporter [Gemmatimonadota bacterium]
MRSTPPIDLGSPISGVATGEVVPARRTAVTVLIALSICHLLNDVMQSLLVALYPVFKEDYSLTFSQVGLLAFAFQLTASLLQPVVGWYTDRKPRPRFLAFGMGCTLVGLLVLAGSDEYWLLLLASSIIGLGSSIFHPESSRVARAASGGRHGLAQSVFQVGGNAGSALGPLLAAFVVLPRGQGSVAWFSVVALLAMGMLWWVGSWAKGQFTRPAESDGAAQHARLPRKKVISAIAVLIVLIFSKYMYLAALVSFYTFYLIDRFSVPVAQAQVYLFVFLGAMAAGTIIGGPVGDRVGRKAVIWTSILGILPFTLALPYVGLFWTVVLTAIIGAVLASAFPAIIVYAQELVPGRVGVISGLFFGFAFGMGGLAAVILGVVADWKGIVFVYQVCSFLPLLGLVTILLPPDEPRVLG